MTIKEVTMYRTEDGKTHDTLEAAYRWRNRCILVEKLERETSCSPDDAEEAVDQLLKQYDILPKGAAAELNWVRDVLSKHGYDGPLAPASCPLEDWLKELK